MADGMGASGCDLMGDVNYVKSPLFPRASTRKSRVKKKILHAAERELGPDKGMNRTNRSRKSRSAA